MIKSFKHDGVERFFRTESKAGIQPQHAKKLRVQLLRLDQAKVPEDMNLPGWKFHPLSKDFGAFCGVGERQLALNVFF